MEGTTTFIPTQPITERYGVSFTYRSDLPDDEKQRAWAMAKRRLGGDVFERMYPNRDYTIRYSEQTRQASYNDWIIEGTIMADVTYR